MKLIILLLLAFPCISLSQTVFDLTEEELNPSPEEVLVRRRERFLRDESIIYDLDTTYGVQGERRYTGTDANRLSFAGHFNADYEQITELLGIEFNYMRRGKRYHRAWWGIQGFAHNTFFHVLSVTPSRDTSSNIRGIGPGAGYRFKLLLDFLPTENVFESVDVFVNYLEFEEGITKQIHRGYGLSTNYGIHKRTNSNFFWGGKFSYNIGLVSRPTLETEDGKRTSLTLGWLSYALELGFFY
jgi:hypothetical protein